MSFNGTRHLHFLCTVRTPLLEQTPNCAAARGIPSPHRSCVLTRQMEQLPLGASTTSIVVCTTLRALGPRGLVRSRDEGWLPWPAARLSPASCGAQRARVRVRVRGGAGSQGANAAAAAAAAPYRPETLQQGARASGGGVPRQAREAQLCGAPAAAGLPQGAWQLR